MFLSSLFILLFFFGFYEFFLFVAFCIVFLLFLFFLKILGFALSKKFFEKYANKFSKFLSILKDYVSAHPERIFLSFFISAFYWVVITFSSWLLFMSFGVQLPFLELYFISTGVSLLSMMPFTFNGIGPREAVLIIVISKLGVNPEIIASVSLTSILLNFLIWCLIVLYFSLVDKVTK